MKWSYVSWYFFFLQILSFSLYLFIYLFTMNLYPFVLEVFADIYYLWIFTNLSWVNMLSKSSLTVALLFFLNWHMINVHEFVHISSLWVYTRIGLDHYSSLYFFIFIFQKLANSVLVLSKWLFISWHILNIYEFACFPLCYCINFLYMSLCPHLRKVIFFILTRKSWSMDTPA